MSDKLVTREHRKKLVLLILLAYARSKEPLKHQKVLEVLEIFSKSKELKMNFKHPSERCLSRFLGLVLWSSTTDSEMIMEFDINYYPSVLRLLDDRVTIGTVSIADILKLFTNDELIKLAYSSTG